MLLKYTNILRYIRSASLGNRYGQSDELLGAETAREAIL